MKRLYIAAALLIALLGASLTNAWYAQRLTGGMREELSRALEEELGVPLFERVGRRMVLTEAG